MVSRIPPPEEGGPARPGRPTSAVAVVLVLAVALGIWFFSGRSPDAQTTAGDPSSSSSPAPSGSPTSSPSSTPSSSPSSSPSASASTTTQPEQSPSPSAAPSAGSTAPAIDPESGLPTVYLLDLPPEAAETVEIIDRGPPYPYDKDGSTFGNYEGLLPDYERGYYQEFTVETPGSYDRGARRIVEGADAELYWTDDHYASFSRIVL